jgi:hypothetical protein
LALQDERHERCEGSEAPALARCSAFDDAVASAAHNWEEFYVRHKNGFFKSRSYLLAEFPILKTLCDDVIKMQSDYVIKMKSDDVIKMQRDDVIKMQSDDVIKMQRDDVSNMQSDDVSAEKAGLGVDDAANQPRQSCDESGAENVALLPDHIQSEDKCQQEKCQNNSADSEALPEVRADVDIDSARRRATDTNDARYVRLFEAGCGTGAALLPLLRALPELQVCGVSHSLVSKQPCYVLRVTVKKIFESLIESCESS